MSAVASGALFGGQVCPASCCYRHCRRPVPHSRPRDPHRNRTPGRQPLAVWSVWSVWTVADRYRRAGRRRHHHRSPVPSVAPSTSRPMRKNSLRCHGARNWSSSFCHPRCGCGCRNGFVADHRQPPHRDRHHYFHDRLVAHALLLRPTGTELCPAPVLVWPDRIHHPMSRGLSLGGFQHNWNTSV